MTEDQMAQLEELYNEYSYIKERGDKGGGADLRAAQGMWTLEDVADIFGYRFEYEDTDMRGRIEYPIYRLIKKARCTNAGPSLAFSPSFYIKGNKKWKSTSHI